MNNFRTNKQPKRFSNSVDGMLRPDISRGIKNPGNVLRQTTRRSDLPVSQGRLDNFAQTDGFHQPIQPLINGSERRSIGRQPKRNPSGMIDISLPPSPPKRKKQRRLKIFSRRNLLGAVLCVLLIGGFLFGKGYLKLHQIFKGGAEGAAALQDGVDPSKLKGEGDGRVNILLLGRGGEGHSGPDLTDTILIASIDPIQKKAALLSIPRDLYYPKTSNYRVNSIFAEAKGKALARNASKSDAENAGFAAVENVLEDYLGIPIYYHIMVDFAGFEQAINTVGGVDLNVDATDTVHETLWDELTRKNYVLDVKQGNQHFDGQKALFYARSRYTSPRGDFDRAERQRKLIIALKDKVVSLGTFANPIKISQLLDAFGNHIQSNMGLNEAMRLYEIGKNIHSDSIATIGLTDPPNNFLTSVNIAGQSIQQPRAGLTDFSAIQSYVRNTLKDGFLANENATLAVLNGTLTSGLATTKAAELKSFGYTVNMVGDAPTKTYTKTILVDLTGGTKKYTKHYLEQRLGVMAVNTLPDVNITNPGNADFVIILGQ